MIDLPDDGSFGEEIKHARYYRRRFTLKDPNESLSAVFSSDDGIWVYVNGRFLGHWGAKENQGGCVNDPLGRCGINGTVPPAPISAGLLREGENVIAVKVNNGWCCFSYFNLLVMRVSARFVPNLPNRGAAAPVAPGRAGCAAGIEESVHVMVASAEHLSLYSFSQRGSR